MREELENIIRNLKEVMDDLDKVEAGSYGYKSAAPRARKRAPRNGLEPAGMRGVIRGCGGGQDLAKDRGAS